MEDATRKRLELFVEKAELLNSRSFTKYVVEHGVGLNMNWSVGGPVQLTVKNPDAEATDAFVTTFRMFIQNNDKISIENVAKLVDRDSTLSENWKAQVIDVRQKVNAQLDSPSMCELTIDKDGIPTRSTCRDIMETFLYGELAHTNEKKRLLYQTWKQDAFFFQFIENEFKSVLVDVLNAIFYVCDLNKLELSGQPVPSLPSPEDDEPITTA